MPMKLNHSVARPTQGPGTRRVIAPDDDADFLRDLERKRRREQKNLPDDEPRGDTDT